MRVCIIGAGLAGLSAMRSLLRLQTKLEFVAYEQSNRVGGVWIYGDPYKPTNMYKRLRTNLPKEVMILPGIPFQDKSDEDLSYIGHADFLQYLEEVARQLDLYQYVRFRTSVDFIEPVKQSPDSLTQYKVTVTNLESGEKNSSLFDSLIICNGHYNIPNNPQIKGAQTFTGKITHSMEYREPELYTDKTIVILGARASGVDMATDISEFAKLVYLSHNYDPLPTVFPSNVEQKPGIDHIEHSDIYFKDGSVVKNVDELMFATGYKYEFPFLSPSLQPKIQNQGLVELYKMIVDINNPHVFYIGLNKQIVPAPQFYVQCEYVAALLAGEVELPSHQQMVDDNKARYQRLIVDRSRPEHHYHILSAEQWPYNKEIMLAAGKKPLGEAFQKLYTHSWSFRPLKTMISKYREGIYRLEDSFGEDFVIIKDPVIDN